MCVHQYVFMYVCMHVCIEMYVCMYVCIEIHVCVCMCVCMCVCVYVCVYACTLRMYHVYMCASTCTPGYVQLHTQIRTSCYKLWSARPHTPMSRLLHDPTSACILSLAHTQNQACARVLNKECSENTSQTLDAHVLTRLCRSVKKNCFLLYATQISPWSKVNNRVYLFCVPRIPWKLRPLQHMQSVHFMFCCLACQALCDKLTCTPSCKHVTGDACYAMLRA